MLIINSVIIFMFLILIFQVARQGTIGKGKLPLFQRMAKYLVAIAPLTRLIKPAIKENLNILHTTKIKEAREEQYIVEKLELMLKVIFVGNAMIMFYVIGTRGQLQIEDGQIIRNDYGNGDKTIKTTVYIANDQDAKNPYKLPVDILVSSRVYDMPQLERMYKELIVDFEGIVLGDNLGESGRQICKDLNLVEQVEGYPFLISYKISSFEYIDSGGKLYNEDFVRDQIEDVCITAIFSYEEFEKEYEMNFTIVQKEYEKETYLSKTLDKELALANSDVESPMLTLPQFIDNRQIRFEEKKESIHWYLFVLIGICVVLVSYSKDKDLEKELKKRTTELEIDYPELISKLVLLMNAGLTTKMAFIRIREQYEKENQKGYCYGEICLMLSELNNGIYEETAYEHFGRRCRSSSYMKLTSLLAQNIKKGTKDLSALLEKEAKNSFEERKHLAKRLGEEAGTKLLMPMMLMLAIVMVLIMVPAFLSF